MKSSVRNFLRAEAHDLRPVVMVGKDGIDHRVSRALDEALESHELVKVKFQAHKDESGELAEALAAQVHAEVVRVIGFTAIYFRQNKDPRKRVVSIPPELS